MCQSGDVVSMEDETVTIIKAIVTGDTCIFNPPQ